MSTLNEDLSAIKEVEDKIVANKVARFAYTDEAYTTNDANGVAEYNVSKEQNIPTADASVLKVNETVLDRGYRAQASSVTRMLLNHFFGRMSYNLNKVNDIVSNLITTLIGHRGTANGFATLDENGRIPYSQLPESAMEYKGQWNAETNTPTLADGTGSKGDFYIVSVAGTQNLGSGNIQFFVNDRIIYDGSVWTRLSAGDVNTVNNVLPTNGNVALTGENIPVSSTDPTLLSAPLTTDRYADSSVTTNKLANGSVTTEKIADNAVTNAKIKEPISVANGGTGATTAKGAQKSLLSDIQTETAAIDDTSEFVMKYETPTDTKGAVFKRSATLVWNYIKSKISSVLGLTKDNYGGTADKATNDGDGNNIVGTYALKSNLQYTKSINISKMDGKFNTFYYLIAKTPGMKSASNVESLFVNGSDFRGRMFEGTISTRNFNIVYNYGGNNLPIELYEQTDGTIHVYWLVSDDYTRVVLNMTATNQVTIYGGDLSPVTPTGSKMTLTENDYKPHPYSGMVHTCSTSSPTTTKTVSIPGFTLTQGACIRVVFSDGNSAENPKLKVNSNDAMPIYINKYGNLNFIAKDWDAGISMTLMFNGDSFVVLGNPIVNLKLNLATADTGARRNFIRYASGLLIQWGTVIVNGLTQQPIEAYTGASSYTVLATPSDGAIGWIECLRKDKETIKLAIKTVDGGYTDGTVSWFTIGW